MPEDGNDSTVQVASLDLVPEGLRGLVSETDDGLSLDLAALAPAAKLDEFRDNNRKLFKAKEELESKIKEFGDLDPAKAKEWKEQRDDLQARIDAQSVDKDPEELDQILSKRTEQMRKDFEQRLTGSQKALEEKDAEVEKWRNAFSSTARTNGVAMAANRVEGFRKEALADANALAERVWQPDPENPEKLVPRDEDGRVITGPDGANNITMEEWLASLRTDRPHWFHATADGGGAAGNNGSSAGKQSMSRGQFEKLPPGQQMEFSKKVRSGKAQLTD